MTQDPKELGEAMWHSVNRETPPYPVPSGYVPRVSGNTAPKPKHAAAIQQAVDTYLEMERKARAWDELYVRAHDDLSLLALMEGLVHPAPDASTC